MTIKHLYILLFAASLAVGCTREPLMSEEGPKPQDEKVQAIVPGQAIVLFNEEFMRVVESDLEKGAVVTKSSELNGLARELGIASMERVFPYAGEFEERTRAAGLHRWYRVTYNESVP